LSEDEERDRGKELDGWRSQHFKAKDLPLIRPFSAVTGSPSRRRSSDRHRLLGQKRRARKISHDSRRP
jgi:hypothetical protein